MSGILKRRTIGVTNIYPSNSNKKTLNKEYRKPQFHM